MLANVAMPAFWLLLFLFTLVGRSVSVTVTLSGRNSATNSGSMFSSQTLSSSLGSSTAVSVSSQFASSDRSVSVHSSMASSYFFSQATAATSNALSSGALSTSVGTTTLNDLTTLSNSVLTTASPLSTGDTYTSATPTMTSTILTTSTEESSTSDSSATTDSSTTTFLSTTVTTTLTTSSVVTTTTTSTSTSTSTSTTPATSPLTSLLSTTRLPTATSSANYTNSNSSHTDAAVVGAVVGGVIGVVVLTAALLLYIKRQKSKRGLYKGTPFSNLLYRDSLGRPKRGMGGSAENSRTELIGSNFVKLPSVNDMSQLQALEQCTANPGDSYHRVAPNRSPNGLSSAQKSSMPAGSAFDCNAYQPENGTVVSMPSPPPMAYYSQSMYGQPFFSAQYNDLFQGPAAGTTIGYIQSNSPLTRAQQDSIIQAYQQQPMYNYPLFKPHQQFSYSTNSYAASKEPADSPSTESFPNTASPRHPALQAHESPAEDTLDRVVDSYTQD